MRLQEGSDQGSVIDRLIDVASKLCGWIASAFIAAMMLITVADVALVQGAALLDWADVDPAIFGTLFERGLDPGKRSQLGAHYTVPEMIERVIGPVVRQPLLAEWAAAREDIARALDAGMPDAGERDGAGNGAGDGGRARGQGAAAGVPGPAARLPGLLKR